MGSVFLMNLGLEMYKLYNAIFDVFFKNILFGQVLYPLSWTVRLLFFFKCQVQRAHTFYLESHIITLYREKKVYENVTYHTMIYRAYYEKY